MSNSVPLLETNSVGSGFCPAMQLSDEGSVKVVSLLSLVKKPCFLQFCNYRIGHNFLYNFLHMSRTSVENCTGNDALSCRIGNLTICKRSGIVQFISSMLYQEIIGNLNFLLVHCAMDLFYIISDRYWICAYIINN